MERMLRLGDLVDDYCPRERRLTNHAIVAIVEQAIKQTRCTTCDTEHVFKGGRVPPRRSRGAADTGELVDNSGGQLVAPASAVIEPAAAPPAPAAPIAMSATPASDTPVTSDQHDAPAEQTEGLQDDRANEVIAWSSRALIRATLPRTENDAPPPRPIPEFTMHRYNPRAASGFGRGRGGGGWDRGQGFGGRGGRQGNGNGNANGNVDGNGNGNGGGNGGFGSGQGHGQGRRRRGKGRPR